VAFFNGDKPRSPVNHCRKSKKKSASLFQAWILSMPDVRIDESFCRKDGRTAPFSAILDSPIGNLKYRD
jgi:hypothetical protein